MKILIAYDGSDSSDAALEDLKSAGLPKTAETTVVSLADVFLPPPNNEEVDGSSPNDRAGECPPCLRKG